MPRAIPTRLRKLPGVVDVITDKAQLPRNCAISASTTGRAGITRFDDHQRAFVKVQDGCLLNCTFCIIPSVRPHVAQAGRPRRSSPRSTDLVAGG